MEAAALTLGDERARGAAADGRAPSQADSLRLSRLVTQIEQAFAGTGEYPATLARELLPLAETMQDPRALTLAHLGLVLESRRRSPVLRAPLQRARLAVHYARQQSDPALRCRAHLLLAAFATCAQTTQDGVAEAYEHAQITLTIADDLDDAMHHARALVVLAETAHLCGDTLASRRLYEAALLNIARARAGSYHKVQTQWESRLALADDLLARALDAQARRTRTALLARALSHADMALRHAQDYRDLRARHRSSFWACEAKYRVLVRLERPPADQLAQLSRAMKRHIGHFTPLAHELAARALCVAELACSRRHPALAWALLSNPACASGAMQDQASRSRWLSQAIACFPVQREPQRYRMLAREQVLCDQQAHWARTLARTAVQAKRSQLERLRAEQFLADELCRLLSSAQAALASAHGGPAAAREAARSAARTLDDALEAISDYMAEARLDEHQVLAAPVADLQALVHDVVNEVEPRAYQRGVSITMADGARPAFVQGKYPALHRALLTVVGRAVRGAVAGSEVTVTLAPGRARHALRVEGTGTRLADGLACTRRIVRMHFGRLGLRTRVVKGCAVERVEIVLPAALPGRPAADATAPTSIAAVPIAAEHELVQTVEHLVQRMDEAFRESGEYPAALARELLPLAEASGSGQALARAHLALCVDAMRSDAAAAHRPLQHARLAVRAARQQANLSLRCHALLMAAGFCPCTPEGAADAYAYASQALGFADWLDDAAWHALALKQLGMVAVECGDAPMAAKFLEAAVLNIERVTDRTYLRVNTRTQCHRVLARLMLERAATATAATERQALLQRAREHAETALTHARGYRDARALHRAVLWCGDTMFQVLAEQDVPPRAQLLRLLRLMKRNLQAFKPTACERALRVLCLAQLAGLCGRDHLAWRLLQDAACDEAALKDGETRARWLELAVRHFPVSDGPERYRSIVTDQALFRRRATSQHALVSAMVQSKRAELERSCAVQFLAHDLRSPLSSAVAALNEALGGEGDHTLPGAVQLAHKKLERAFQSIGSATTLARIGEHEIVSSGLVDVHELVHDVVGDIEPLACRRGLSIRVVRANAAFTVGKRAALHRALANLLHNAVKFSRSGGEVRVALESAGGRLRVRIRDCGPGLRIDDRLAQSLEHVSTGEIHGLGLASARRIVRAHFGRLVLRNDPSGAGAVAEVTLPAAPAPSAAA